jgi:molybdopterin molybdotransferase
VSSLVSFELFVRPALRQMAGHAARFRPVIAAIADEPLERAFDAKVHVLSVRAHIGEDGRVHVCIAGTQASHVLSSMACANALALLPDGGGVAAGSEVETLILDADSLGGVGAIVAVPQAVSA